MKAESLAIPGLVLFVPDIYRDERGWFCETFQFERYSRYLPPNISFVQDNMSVSKYGVIRGLHYQKPPFAQSKLVRCTQGRILDVAVDIRTGSDSYLQFAAVELDEDNQQQLFIPAGFAHGFVVLSAQAIVEYKCDVLYHPQADAGIRFDDPVLTIDWKIESKHWIVSAKDMKLPLIREIERI